MRSTKIFLGVNVDHIATLRQARYRGHVRDYGEEVEPDCVEFALLCEQAGAEGITMHLREDRRHVQESDVKRARAKIKTRLNLEMACTQKMIKFAEEIRPDSVCLVPENREEITTEGGLDVLGQKSRVGEFVSAMSELGIITSLFVDPDPAQIEVSAELKSPFIELHTGAYANKYYTKRRSNELEILHEAAVFADSLGLRLNAGHGINYTNISSIVSLPHINELNIGHSIVSRSFFVGVTQAVCEMKSFLS